MKRIRRMKPFYLVPLPTTDARPYIDKPIMDKPWSQKPSFLMVYYLINGNVLTRDCSVKGGPTRPVFVAWKLYDRYIEWCCNEEVHIWELGKDYNIRLAKDINRFEKYKRNPVICCNV